MNCRSGCGACCIAPSISPSFPALPDGKPAGVRCPHLGDDERCALFGRAERPATCVTLRPQLEMCGESRAQAMATLGRWETLTKPATPDVGADHTSPVRVTPALPRNLVAPDARED